jgi:YD repeat-containing protein
MPVLFDEGLARRLALPLAQLYSRAHNAKTPLERHLAAYYLWEAALKLLGSLAVVEYARLGPSDPSIAQCLQNLVRPSLGHWWDFVRRLLPILADAGVEGLADLRDQVLGRSRSDLPRAAGLDALLLETLEGRAGARNTVRLTELLDRLVHYRNREMGHGAAGQRPAEFHDRLGQALLAAAAEVFDRVDVLAGRELIQVDEVRRQPAGDWLVEAIDLRGELPRRRESLRLPPAQAADLPRPGRVYLLGRAGSLVELHPLVLFDPEAEEVLLLNARRGRQRTEYLCYTSGRALTRDDLGGEQRELLARVLGMPVEEDKAREWAARSEAEEGPGDPPAPAPRRQLGEFELLSELGRGGMGRVYRAWQPSLGRQVALKELLRTGDRKAEARFAREIRALGRVEHPSLVKIYTSGAEGEHWFYVMELIEGAPLSAVCDRLHSSGLAAPRLELSSWQEAVSSACQQAREAEKPLAGSHPGEPSKPPSAPGPAASVVLPPGTGFVQQVVELIRQVARAAHALHEAGVVHRDIKPGNIMVTADGTRAVLMDLGLAQLADEVEGRLTRTRQFVGTLRYASPQQVLAVARLDRRSDVYSLGATLWELLTLRPLYGATEQTPTPELIERIQHEEPERLRRHNPAVPRDLEAIVHKCLEKNPARRYATAQELAEDLKRCQDGAPVQARPIGRLARTARWARRRPAKAAVLLGGPLLLLGLAVLAFTIWDRNYRVKVGYYGQMVRRWGLPEGVGPLTEEQVGHRNRSFKFVRRAGRVERVEVVNGLGAPAPSPVVALLGNQAELALPGDHVFGGHYTPQVECRYEYKRDDRGRLLEETARDRTGRVVWRLRYTSDRMANFTNDEGIPASRSPSGAVFIRFEWSAEGFEKEIRYLDRFGKPQAGRDGTHGRLTTVDARGLPTEETYLGPKGQPGLHREGFGRRTLRYDDQGRLLEQAWFDSRGRPALAGHLAARETYGYDSWGNRVDWAFFGRDGRPALCACGIARCVLAYDDPGNLVEQRCEGLDGKPCLHRDRFARAVNRYDHRGNCTEWAYFDTEGKPIVCSRLYHRAEAVYDDVGNTTQRAYFGTDNKPTLWTDGYHKNRNRYDERGNWTEAVYFNVDGTPMPHLWGYYKSTARFDEADNEVEDAYFDLDDRAALHRDGYHKCIGVPDERGNWVEMIYLGPDGKPTLHKDGYHRWTAEYDERGNWTRTDFFGLDGQPVLHRDGSHRWLAGYDERGNRTESASLGTDGKPYLCRDGYYKSKWAYDERGNRVEHAFFGLDGKPCLHKEGFARITAAFDERDNEVRRAFFGLDGNPVLTTNGTAGWTAHYNPRGNRIEQAFLGTDERPAAHKDGYHKVKTEYDERGNQVGQGFFDAQDRRVRCRDGYHRWEARYDGRGNQIEQSFWSSPTFFGTEDRPVACADGYHKKVTRYDLRNNPSEETYFDVAGKPALHKDGHARVVWKYDGRDELVETTYYNRDGKVIKKTPAGK